MSQAQVDAARRWLTRSLSDAMGSVPTVGLHSHGVFIAGAAGPGDDQDLQPHGDGGVLAFDALGTLPPEELERWRARFEAGRRHQQPGGGPDPDGVAAAESHLRELVASIAAAADPEERSAALGRLSGALGLLLRVGLVEADALGALAEQVGRALGEPPHAPHPEPWKEDEPLVPGDIGEPRAVIAAPLARHDGVCITCVELYEAGVRIHWHALRDKHPPEDPRFAVSDDAGTRYGESFPSGGSWSPIDVPFAYLGSSTVAGAPPADARTLTIAASDGAEWTIPLTRPPAP